jgi:hypothetical protein
MLEKEKKQHEFVDTKHKLKLSMPTCLAKIFIVAVFNIKEGVDGKPLYHIHMKPSSMKNLHRF